jgi:glycosyltransferase involved in cell wall biosynthesis
LTQPRPILLAAYKLHVGGNERDLAKLARHLDPRRFQVHVASFDPHGERVAELEAASIPILNLPVRSFLNTSVLQGAEVFHDYIRKHRIEIVHAFDATTSIFAVPLARLHAVHAVSSHCFFRHLIPQPYHAALRAVDWSADRIVVNAEAIKQHLIEDFGVREKRIFVSYNGVETNVFFPQAEARPEFLQDAPVVIGSLCVMREEKRLDTLIEAFARVLSRHRRLRLLLVGDGAMREPWMRRSGELGLGEACHFEQTTTDIPRWIRMMDVFVLPSRSEGFPNALLEAMACGCSVVASAVGGIPELVEDGRSGFLFPPGNVEALAERLDALVESPELRRATSAAASLRARERFSMQAAAERMASFYDSLP